MDIKLNYKLIGMRLRSARKQKGYTQEYLAELADISPQHCSGVECGSAKLSLPCLINMCNALCVAPNDILMDSVDNNAPELIKDIATVFSDCSNDEIFLMLAMAEHLKTSLRLKDIKLTRSEI